jgi:hypothetical protein
VHNDGSANCYHTWSDWRSSPLPNSGLLRLARTCLRCEALLTVLASPEEAAKRMGKGAVVDSSTKER